MATRSLVLTTYRSTGARETVVIFTAPANWITLVKSVLIFNEGVPATGVQLIAHRAITGVYGRFFYGDLATNQLVDHSTWTVMEQADEIIGVFPSPAIQVWISGARLPLP